MNITLINTSKPENSLYKTPLLYVLSIFLVFKSFVSSDLLYFISYKWPRDMLAFACLLSIIVFRIIKHCTDITFRHQWTDMTFSQIECTSYISIIYFCVAINRCDILI